MVNELRESVDKNIEQTDIPDGWLNATAFADQLGIHGNTWKKVLKRFGPVKSEWVKEFSNKQGKGIVFYHPDYIKEIVDFVAKNSDEMPEGWITTNALAKELSTALPVVFKMAEAYRESNPEWFKEFTSKAGRKYLYFHPALIKKVTEDYQKYSAPPTGWATLTSIHRKLNGYNFKALNILIEKKYPFSFNTDQVGDFRGKDGKVLRYYHPDIVEAIIKDILAPRLPRKTGWKTVTELSDDLCIARAVIKKLAEEYRDVHQDWFENVVSDDGHNKILTVLHPELVKIIFNRYKNREGFAPNGWQSPQTIARETGVFFPAFLKEQITKYRELHPEWFAIYLNRPGRRVEHYHPELVKIIRVLIENYVSARTGLVRLIDISREADTDVEAVRRAITKLSIPYKKILDESNKFCIFVDPAVVDVIKDEILRTHRIIKAVEPKVKKDVEPRHELEQYIKDIGLSSAELGDYSVDFKQLIRIFGSSGAVILLYELRPDFKSIPVEHVKRVLAEYLGSYLSIKHAFNLKDVVAAAKFLSNPSLRQRIFENVKADCLNYYFEQRKNGSSDDAYQIIYSYLVQSLDELGGDIPKVVEDMIMEVMDYYTSAIRDFHKPEKFVDKLSEGRDFPDLHQRINMKELKDKKRMLIADEMGLGKSASVIMAKEQMGLGCALVIVPGSVVKLGTWQNYLCDDPERKGYFRAGTAPRVLVVESPSDLQGVTKDQYDYVIVSHERLNNRYAALLSSLDPDLLIVDEVHKLKNLNGKRSGSLMPLVSGLGDEKYVALLSGTPIPNKVRDIAFVLKLLYPGQFGKMQDSDLVKTIIQSSADEILKMLIPHMQMKELEDVVEMPNRKQEVVDVKMSKVESDVYEGLLELDELTAKEKMGALRKFLMNPALLDSTPSYEGSKLVALRSELQGFFKTKSKAVVFVNEYTTGVLRCRNAVLVKERLGLPPDVAIEAFHGEEGNDKLRPKIQHRFNNTPERMVIFISGKTSDVGNSFVAAEETLVYSEPWTEADLRQQLARVFRPGLDHDIHEKIFVVGGSIEQGIHEYIRHKYKIIEKVLKGIPTTEIEQRILKNAENQKDDSGIGDRIDFEINSELARDYFSWKQKLDQFFGYTKENGEERIAKFLETWGADYARGYREMGARSYQSNVNRASGALIGEMVDASGRHPATLQILDIASGPEMLRRHIGSKLQQNVSSIDINPHHFIDSTSGRARVASWTKIPCKPRTIDYINCAMAFQSSSFAPSRGMYERVNVLREMNRVLKSGGRAVISMIYSMRMSDMDKFKLFADALGFKIIDDFSGLATRGEDFESQIITLEKIADCEKTAEQVVKAVGHDNVSGLKFERLEKKKLKKSRKVMTGFYLDERKKIINLNDTDLAITREEKEVEDHVRALVMEFKSVKQIPAEQIIANNYIRVFVSGSYHLFKRLKSAPGIIVLNDALLRER